MRIASLAHLHPLLNKDDVIDAVRQSFIRKESGQLKCPPPIQMMFYDDIQRLEGDCHVKAAQDSEGDYFSIKVATGFYRNTTSDIPVNNGLSLLMSSHTGYPVALFQDQGMLTAWRTAAAGALAAGLYPGIGPDTVLGIVGTGQQAELQALWICHWTGINRIKVLARNDKSAVRFIAKIQASGLDCGAVHHTVELAREAGIIVTATPSTHALLHNTDIADGTHIIAVGSDSPGKQELDPALLQRAEVIITDDHQQCLAHGEFGIAVREQFISEHTDIAFGTLLASDSTSPITGNSVSVVDLTGVGGQDLAIASYFWNKMIAQEA